MHLKEYIRANTWQIIGIATVLGLAFPKQGIILQPYLPYLLMLLMFFGCLGINLKDIASQRKNTKKLLAILAIIHLLSPVMVLLLKQFFSEEIFVGIILASVMSSGMAVVFLSYLYGGVASGALAITSVSNLLSPLLVPALVLVFAHTTIKIDPITMAINMLKLVLLPFILASAVRQTRIYKPLNEQAPYLSVGVLFLLVIGMTAPVQPIIKANILQSFYLLGLITVLSAINFFIGFLLGSNTSEKITYAISASYKNCTLSTVLALSLFNQAVALPSIIYSIVNNLMLIPLQNLQVKRIRTTKMIRKAKQIQNNKKNTQEPIKTC